MAAWTNSGKITPTFTDVIKGTNWSLNGSSILPSLRVPTFVGVIKGSKWSLNGSAFVPSQIMKEASNTTFYWKNS